MLKTMEALERSYCHHHLYQRHLVVLNSEKEGAFLAGTCWIAQHWVVHRNREKVEATLGAALRSVNDAGVMSEEGKIRKQGMIG